MRQRLVYLLARLLRVSTPMVFVAPDNVALQLKELDAKWQEALRIATARAFLAGHAQGEIEGKLAVAEELQVAHGEGGGERPMTQNELDILGKRQVH